MAKTHPARHNAARRGYFRHGPTDTGSTPPRNGRPRRDNARHNTLGGRGRVDYLFAKKLPGAGPWDKGPEKVLMEGCPKKSKTREKRCLPGVSPDNPLLSTLVSPKNFENAYSPLWSPPNILKTLTRNFGLPQKFCTGIVSDTYTYCFPAPEVVPASVCSLDTADRAYVRQVPW